MKPLSEYPRPQFKRDSYICLNGIWEYAIRKEETIPESFDGEILVPYSPEVEKSGVNKVVMPDDYLFYRLRYEIPKNLSRIRLYYISGRLIKLPKYLSMGNSLLNILVVSYLLA